MPHGITNIKIVTDGPNMSNLDLASECIQWGYERSHPSLSWPLCIREALGAHESRRGDAETGDDKELVPRMSAE